MTAPLARLSDTSQIARMSPGGDGRLAAASLRVGAGVLMLALFGVLLVYGVRITVDLPLYPASEGGYLIQALYGKALAGRPGLLPDVQGLSNTAFFLIIRALTYVTQDLLAWARALGACAYFAGLLLVWRSLRSPSGDWPPLGYLLLALAFPFYRFAFAVLPDGWYVGVLGLTVLVTTRLYMARPILHGLLAGALSALLILLKPHGLAVAAAFLALAALDAFIGWRDVRVLLARVAGFSLGLLAFGNLLLIAAGQPVLSPLAFLTDAQPWEVIDAGISTLVLSAAARSLAPLLSSVLLLAGVPALTGLVRIEMRWRWIAERKLGPFRLEPQEVTFLLVLLTLIATLAMMIAFDPGEPNRLAGRDFEFLAPILWLTAAPFVAEFDRSGTRWWRAATALATGVGVAGLAICLFSGAVATPWDAAALSAFFQPDAAKLLLSPAIPYFALAIAATLAACAGMAFTAWPTQRIWFGCFAALAMISTLADVAWERSVRPGRAVLAAELRQADAIVARRGGGVAVAAGDQSAARQIFLGLRGRPGDVLVGPGASLAAMSLGHVDTLVVSGDQLPSSAWTPVFEGASIKAFGRAAPPHLDRGGGEALGSGAVSG